MTNDDAVVRGEIVALKITVRALMQRLYEVDPNASSKLRNEINQEIQQHTSHEERAAAQEFCTRYLFEVIGSESSDVDRSPGEERERKSREAQAKQTTGWSA